MSNARTRGLKLAPASATEAKRKVASASAAHGDAEDVEGRGEGGERTAFSFRFCLIMLFITLALDWPSLQQTNRQPARASWPPNTGCMWVGERLGDCAMRGWCSRLLLAVGVYSDRASPHRRTIVLTNQPCVSGRATVHHVKVDHAGTATRLGMHCGVRMVRWCR